MLRGMDRHLRTLVLMLATLLGLTGITLAQGPPTTHPAPLVQSAPPITALSPTLRVREARTLRDGRETINIRYPVVDRGDPLANADLAARVEAEVLRTGMGGYGYSRGRCQATLATETLVSVLCEYTTLGARGSPPAQDAASFTFRLLPGEARRVSMAEVFVEGARIENAVCAKALGRDPDSGDPMCFPVAIAFGPRGIRARWTPRRSRARTVEIPYAELAPYIRPDGPLAFASGPAPATPSPATVAAAPSAGTRRLTCAYFGEPMDATALGRLALQVNLTRVYVMLDATPDGRFRFAARVTSTLSADEEARYVGVFGARADGPCPYVPVHLARSGTTGQASLRDTPDGPVVATLSSGATVVQFNGLVHGHDSQPARLPPSVLRFVVGNQVGGFSRDPVFRGY